MPSSSSSSAKRTALITGASAGLGKEFAKLFAADGHDVVLVARSVSRLEDLAADLRKTHGVEAHVIGADLGETAGASFVVEQVNARRLTIDFLVNNAGVGSNGAFLDLELSRELQIVDVNMRALVELSHRLGRPMRERGFGRIMNVASTAGLQPGPFMSTYYATKAFVISFSEALAFELQGTGVSVTCHCPGATATEFAATAGNDKSRLFKQGAVADAKEVATHAYRAMMKGELVSIHGALNKVWREALRFSPRWMVKNLTATLNKPA